MRSKAFWEDIDVELVPGKWLGQYILVGHDRRRMRDMGCQLVLVVLERLQGLGGSIGADVGIDKQ